MFKFYFKTILKDMKNNFHIIGEGFSKSQKQFDLQSSGFYRRLLWGKGGGGGIKSILWFGKAKSAKSRNTFQAALRQEIFAATLYNAVSDRAM